MEFRKMVMITVYVKQKKRHRCTEQTFGLCGRRRGWDVSREQHRNIYIIFGETDHQPRLDAWDKCLGLVHWEDPEGLGGEGGVGGGSGWGTHVNPWLIHVHVWQNPLQYCIVISLQPIKINEKKTKESFRWLTKGLSCTLLLSLKQSWLFLNLLFTLGFTEERKYTIFSRVSIKFWHFQIWQFKCYSDCFSNSWSPNSIFTTDFCLPWMFSFIDLFIQWIGSLKMLMLRSEN